MRGVRHTDLCCALARLLMVVNGKKRTVECLACDLCPVKHLTAGRFVVIHKHHTGRYRAALSSVQPKAINRGSMCRPWCLAYGTTALCTSHICTSVSSVLLLRANAYSVLSLVSILSRVQSVSSASIVYPMLTSCIPCMCILSIHSPASADVSTNDWPVCVISCTSCSVRQYEMAPSRSRSLRRSHRHVLVSESAMPWQPFPN